MVHIQENTFICTNSSRERKKFATAIRKYAAENDPTYVVKYFSGKLKMQISKPTARKFKEKYFRKLHKLIAKQPCSSGSSTTCPPVEVKALPTKIQSRPLILGKELDKCVQDYIKNPREIGGIVAKYCNCNLCC